MKQSSTWFDVYLVNVKSSWRLFRNLVTFSECLNRTLRIDGWMNIFIYYNFLHIIRFVFRRQPSEFFLSNKSNITRSWYRFDSSKEWILRFLEKRLCMYLANLAFSSSIYIVCICLGGKCENLKLYYLIITENPKRVPCRK